MTIHLNRLHPKLRTCNFPTRLLKTTEYTKVLADCIDFIEKGRSIYIFGPSGVGKTQTAIDIIRYLFIYSSDIEPYFVSIPTIVNDLAIYNKLQSSQISRKFANKESDSKTDAYFQLISKTHTIFDDIGRERKSSWSESIVYRLINDRYTADKPTIITSNLSIGELEIRYGTQIASRICEMCEIIYLDGTNRRLRSV